jgi:hypothetical protein
MAERRMKFLGRRDGRGGERRPKRVLTAAEKERLTAQLRNAGYAGGDSAAAAAARARHRADAEALMRELQTCDIITFTTKFLHLSLEGYPFLELLLRTSEGMALPEGMVRTFVEGPSDGFAVREVEMSWADYFALCCVHQKVYRPGRKPATVMARAGRRSGKSTAGAIKALYYGTRSCFRQYVRANEIVRIPILATSQDQAEDIIKQRCQEVLKNAGMEWLIGPLDPKLHAGEATSEIVPLVCGTEIEAFPCNSKKVRGEAAPLVTLDEYAHFAADGRKKDKDIRSAATGAQAQFPGYQVYIPSTPLAEQGDFYESELLAEGDPSVLCFHVASWTAAPVLYRNNPEFYHNEFRRDPDGFTREFRAEYAKSSSAMYHEDDMDACMVLAGETPFDPALRYGAGIDQSGLTGKDRFSLSVCYYDPARDVVGLAFRRSWLTKDLDLIMGECREALRRYGVREVLTDRYAGGYVAAALAKVGLTCTICGRNTELHMEFNRLLVARKVELPVDLALKEGLLQTNLVLSKANNPTVTHPRSSKGHGDEVEALVRAAHQAVAGNWLRSAPGPEERAAQEALARAEAAYDPLTYGRR